MSKLVGFLFIFFSIFQFLISGLQASTLKEDEKKTPQALVVVTYNDNRAPEVYKVDSLNVDDLKSDEKTEEFLAKISKKENLLTDVQKVDLATAHKNELDESSSTPAWGFYYYSNYWRYQYPYYRTYYYPGTYFSYYNSYYYWANRYNWLGANWYLYW